MPTCGLSTNDDGKVAAVPEPAPLSSPPPVDETPPPGHYAPPPPSLPSSLVAGRDSLTRDASPPACPDPSPVAAVLQRTPPLGSLWCARVY